MKFIAKDQGLFELLRNKLYITSSEIRRLNIFTTDNDELVIEIEFELVYNSGATLMLRLLKIKEYAFYWSNKYNFYTVETVKILKQANFFYMSFDPYEGAPFEISENDQDFISFESFEGYFLDPVPLSQQSLLAHE